MPQENTFSPFPDILSPDKGADTYGIQYARAIWGSYQSNINQYDLQRQRAIINRRYAEGLQDFDKYKSRKGITNTSYLNLDFTPVNIIATTVDNLVGRLSGTDYKIQCNAIDPESKTRFDDYRKKLYADMFLKPYSDEIASKTGIPLVNPNQSLPETDEEAELHLSMNYKEEASIAMEEALNFVFSSNMFEQDKQKVLRDLVSIKKAAFGRYYDEDNNIKVDYEDPVDIITPYSKYDDFRDIPYVAVVKSYTINDLVTMNKGRWTDEQIYEIAKNNAGRNNNPAWQWGTSWDGYYNTNDLSFSRPYYNFNIQVLKFYFIGIDSDVMEFNSKRRRKKFNKADLTKDLPDGSELVSKKIEHLYGGYWIINSTHIFNYGKIKNVPREKINGSYSPKVTLPIKIIAPGIYDMQNKSLVERMIPHEDQINLANLAFQTLMIKMKPPGVAVDMRGLIDAAKGLGNDTKPLDLVKIYEATGNYVYSSIAEEGDVINSRVITELRGGLSDAMRDLISVYQFQKNLINEVIGINPYVDPISAKSEAGLGVQDNAIMATNNSLRPLFNSFLSLLETLSKEVALMIQDSLEYNNEAFINAIGSHSTKTLEYGSKLAMVQMGIKIELLPDEKEKMEVVQMMQLGIQAGTLTSSDVFRINQVMKQDVKLASKLLSFLENKNRKNKIQESMELQRQNAEVQAQAAQQASEAQLKASMQIEQFKQATLQMEYQLKNQFEDEQIRRALMLQSSKNEGMIDVAKINNDGKIGVQFASNEGKQVVADKTNEGKLIHEAYKQATAPKKEK